MLEFLLLGICFGSHIDSTTCQKSWDKYHEQTPELDTFTKDAQRRYYDPLDQNVKYAMGTAAIAYKGDIKFGLTKTIYVEDQWRDDHKLIIGYKISFP